MKPMKSTTVGIVDDHPIVRRGLGALLDAEPDISVVGQATSAASALTMVARTSPDVVLVDLKLSAGDDSEGLTLCAALAKRYPASKVLVLSAFANEWLIVQAIRHGARGYVVKDVDLTELVRAIRAVSAGGSAFDACSAGAVVRWMHASPVGAGAVPASDVTHREREILALLAQGLSNVAIGQRLYISAATVKFHVANVMRKLGAKRRAEAVFAAAKLGLI
jgi:two-component system, NarL family, response regulator DevR